MHSAARTASARGARESIAAMLDAAPEEMIFTSGATEANNLAIFGLAGEAPCHILSSAIEHPCVVEPIKQLAAHGCAVENLPVNSEGAVNLSDLPQRVRRDTRLIALMLVNHETGAIQSIPQTDIPWHCDAAQAVGKQPVRFRTLGAATLAFSGHKFGAPPGIGALIVRRGEILKPMLFGGHQQQERRPGTESAVLAAGMAKALELACIQMDKNSEHVRKLRNTLVSRLNSEAGPAVVNGPTNPEGVSPYVLNISFPGLRGDALVMALDLAGVACSTGSACSSGSMLPSPVLRAMQLRDDVVRSAVRFSFNASTPLEEVERTTAIIIECVKKMRGDPMVLE